MIEKIKAYKIGNKVITLGKSTGGYYVDVATASHSNLYFGKTAEAVLTELLNKEGVKLMKVRGCGVIALT